MATNFHRLNIQMHVENVAWLWRQRFDIDFEPIYQRKSNIWSVANQQYLIDSILNGFDIPKIYLADFSYGVNELNDKGLKYAVIDGKQRLNALFDFMDGKYPLSKEFEFYSDPSVEIAGKYWKDISLNFPEIAYKLEDFKLAIMAVVTDDEANISQLFVRLNTSKPLTGAELRNAMPGRVPAIIRELVNHPFLSEYLPFSTVRSEDKNLAAKLLLIEHRGAPVDTKKRQLDALVRAIANDGDPQQAELGLLELLAPTESIDFQASANRVRDNLTYLTEVFGMRDPLLRQPSQIPVFYWFIRNLDHPDPSKVRTFLEFFQAAREDNKIKAKAGDTTTPDLDRYELLLRSSNDSGSIKQRHAILVRWWAMAVRNLV
ncbi:hypothetical protein GGQ87_000387 [Brevundimonas alba]|uniref:GmrSD restriction endonucleases N-terminal domain-containing protein n=1 Tax=Brevundimonas alba TaxID=74314 RepID=A0A7X6BMR0_9CAUL|nr:DUF262 domain-containing protein [Brevundimonas alba]NJC40129.1 hypothetical protein [Brevundimonas alba]